MVERGQNFLPSSLKLHNISFHLLFIHLPVGHMDCFHLLATMKNAAVDIGVQIYQVSAFSSFGYIPTSGIAISCGNNVFSFLRIF